ncbi:MAG: hypothetical protein FRX48_02914 [Lasallia pustulata]|uniref:Chitin synthesis regulation, Congo red resistance, RCR protein n=1 Tax=Lasallia pustulata TaxID=136370 RepID=A0A5M8PU84_9LECA|nr:MAG: hypothetical protein FRX48_02914 [Lasallia pustulata]
MILPRVYYDCGDGYAADGYGCNSAWGNYGRWILTAAIIVALFFLFFLFACITARRRRRAGMNPYRGTGWAAGRTPPGHAPATYAGAPPQQYNSGYTTGPAPPPVYSPPAGQSYYGNGSQGYFGGQQNAYELQQPTSSYQPQSGGDPVYSAPTGPPPGKKGGDGIIR